MSLAKSRTGLISSPLFRILLLSYKNNITVNDAVYMNRCLELAQRAEGYTRPNPMVGAVLVHADRVIGEGYHHNYGSAHAEVSCLESVDPSDRHLIPDSTMYVNLEPCAHYGLTPPCATRLISEKIRKVVIANVDPFREVDGKGVTIMREMGIDVETGLLAPEGLWLNRRFFCFQTKKRPYIILKWARSSDGFIAHPGGKKARISSPDSITMSHKWRSREAAIMVGYLTALNDNPQLTARQWHGRQPLRIALDRNLTLPQQYNLFNEDAATWIVNEQRETISGQVHYIQVPFANLLPALLTRLHEANILSLIVEGGGQLLNSFLAAGLWDEARVVTSPQPLEQGITAPLGLVGNKIMTGNSGVDTLEVYTNKNTAFPYAPGMPL